MKMKKIYILENCIDNKKSIIEGNLNTLFDYFIDILIIGKYSKNYKSINKPTRIRSFVNQLNISLNMIDENMYKNVYVKLLN